MIVPYQDVLGFTGESDSFVLSKSHAGIEAQVKKHLRWNPEQVVHTNKLYDGSGGQYLNLDEMHVTAVKRVATTREDAINIKNTATDATNAYVSVVYTSNAPASMSLVVEGGASDSDSSLAFATHTTLTALIAAINALGNGWSAAISDSDYGSYKTTNLLELANLDCTSWDGTAASWEYVGMAAEPVSSVRLYGDRGQLYSPSAFPGGHRNVAISYTSGYTLATIPNDISLAVLTLLKFEHSKADGGMIGIAQYSLGHLSVRFADTEHAGLFSEVEAKLEPHRRPLI